jgi:hypothetical protein
MVDNNWRGGEWRFDNDWEWKNWNDHDGCSESSSRSSSSGDLWSATGVDRRCGSTTH